MKASINFREDKIPLAKAKVPVSILGFPFLSGISAGDTKELRLDLSTAFDSGPSLRVSYRPNDSWNPFSLVVKTGIGTFGSPTAAPMSMSAEFNLLGPGGNPSFSILFKPRVGDFCIKKTIGSAGGTTPTVLGRRIAVEPNTDEEGSVDRGETPVTGFRPANGVHSNMKANGFPTELPVAGGIHGLYSGTVVTASSVLPLRNRTAVRFRWGVRIPSELRTAFLENGRRNPTAGISLPRLVMSKVSIEHVAEDGKAKKAKGDVAGDAAVVAQACLSVKRQLEVLQAENGLLKKAVEELRSEVVAGKRVPLAGTRVSGESVEGGGVSVGKGREGDDSGGMKPVTGKRDRRSNGMSPDISGKVKQEDVSEELKKALMGATGAGI